MRIIGKGTRDEPKAGRGQAPRGQPILAFDPPCAKRGQPRRNGPKGGPRRASPPLSITWYLSPHSFGLRLISPFRRPNETIPIGVGYERFRRRTAVPGAKTDTASRRAWFSTPPPGSGCAFH